MCCVGAALGKDLHEVQECAAQGLEDDMPASSQDVLSVRFVVRQINMLQVKYCSGRYEMARLASSGVELDV